MLKQIHLQGIACLLILSEPIVSSPLIIAYHFEQLTSIINDAIWKTQMKQYSTNITVFNSHGNPDDEYVGGREMTNSGFMCVSEMQIERRF